MKTKTIIGYTELDGLFGILNEYNEEDRDRILKYFSLLLPIMEDYLEESIAYEHFFDQVPSTIDLVSAIQKGNPESLKLIKGLPTFKIVNDINIYLFKLALRIHKSAMNDLKVVDLKHCLLDKFYLTLVKSPDKLKLSGVCVYVIEIFYGYKV